MTESSDWSIDLPLPLRNLKCPLWCRRILIFDITEFDLSCKYAKWAFFLPPEQGHALGTLSGLSESFAVGLACHKIPLMQAISPFASWGNLGRQV